MKVSRLKSENLYSYLLPCCILSIFLLASSVSAMVDLMSDGESRVVILLAEEPSDREQLAADELVEYLTLISGVAPNIATISDEINDELPLFIGQAADSELNQVVLKAGNNPSSFVLRVTDERIDIRGLADEGTLFGVYELLEQLGVRWYMPGELGRVVPQNDEPRLDKQQTVQVPSMDYRVFQYYIREDQWRHRMRMGGERRSTGSHGIPPFRGNRNLFEEHPELFALRQGERRFGQICAGNPDAVNKTVEWIRNNYEPTDEKFYMGMGPNDAFYDYCECAKCTPLDGGVYDPLCATTSVTGRYIWFFNQVLDALEDDYPNAHITWYVYATHMMPPPPGLEHNPRIVPVFAPITVDRVRGMDNPMSPDRHVFRYVLENWSRLEPNEMYYRGYYNNLACPQFPLSQIDRIRNEIPVLHDKGVRVMRVECIQQSWASNPISLYLAARMMWDVETDVDFLLDEFYEKFYGPAREPMREYHRELESAFRDTPYFTGSSYLYFPIFKEHPRRERMRGLLEDASALAGDNDTLYSERVKVISKGFERMEIFLDMIYERNRFNFEGAYEKMREWYSLNDEMIDYVLEGDHRFIHAWERSNRNRSMFNRFFALPVASGYKRAVEEGEMVVGLADEWDFLIDPAGIGEIAGYQRPGELGGNWQPLKTVSRSWSDQGLHYYKGDAWYRTHVVIPAEYEGRPVYLWFGGVDNAAKVWVNGELLGTNREPKHGLPGVPGTFRPFDFLASEAIRFGEENTVSVRVTNDRVAELGTGGIVAPVMFWTPHDPGWTPGD